MPRLRARPLLRARRIRAPALHRRHLLHFDQPRLSQYVRTMSTRQLLHCGHHRAIELRARLVLDWLLSGRKTTDRAVAAATAAARRHVRDASLSRT